MLALALVGASPFGLAPARAQQSAVAPAEALDPQTVVTAQNFRGEWRRNARYLAGEVVVFQGSSFAALRDNRRARPNPNRSTLDWGILALRGSRGARGQTGPAGPAAHRMVEVSVGDLP